MRKEFDKLKSELWEGSTTDKNGDNNWYLISELLNNLENKIKEVEGRIEVTKKISSEINNTISKFTTFVDEGKVFKMSIDEHDRILHGSLDIDVALDLNDDMCVVDNWYKIFDSDKKTEKSDENFIPLKDEIDKYKVVEEIISKLKMIDVDGETMEYILNKVGMSQQMHSQLSKKFTLYDI